MKLVALLGIVVCVVVGLAPAQAEAQSFAPGARVECDWKGRGKFFKGKVRARSGDRVSIDYDDGDKEDTTIGRCRSLDAPVTSVLAVGARVECNWKGRGTFFKGKVRARSGDRLSIDYDDGDKEDTTVARCRVLAAAATPPASPPATSPAAPLNPTPTGTAKSVPVLFDEARRRLTSRRGEALLHDASLVGTWARMEVARAGRQVEGLSVFTVTFAADGRGTLTQELVALDARDQLAVVRDRTTTFPLRWGVSVLSRDGKSATALVVEIEGSTTLLAYVRQGTSLGTVPVDPSTGRILGAFQLFSPVASWRTTFAEGAEALRQSLIGARDLRQQLEINSLMQRTMRLGNDNLLMLRTMNAGFSGQFVF